MLGCTTMFAELLRIVNRCYPVWMDFSEVRVPPCPFRHCRLAGPGTRIPAQLCVTVILRLKTADKPFLPCAQCMSKTDDPAKCRALRDDYLECLHHRREVLL